LSGPFWPISCRLRIWLFFFSLIPWPFPCFSGPFPAIVRLVDQSGLPLVGVFLLTELLLKTPLCLAPSFLRRLLPSLRGIPLRVLPSSPLCELVSIPKEIKMSGFSDLGYLSLTPLREKRPSLLRSGGARGIYVELSVMTPAGRGRLSGYSFRVGFFLSGAALLSIWALPPDYFSPPFGWYLRDSRWHRLTTCFLGGFGCSVPFHEFFFFVSLVFLAVLQATFPPPPKCADL